jgi:hypothetical protein
LIRVIIINIFVIITNKKNNILAFIFPDIIKPLILPSRRKTSSINRLRWLLDLGAG